MYVSADIGLNDGDCNEIAIINLQKTRRLWSDRYRG